MIAVIATLPVKPEKREEALAAVKELMAGVADEDGTIDYTLNIDEQDPDTFIFIERYQDMAALTAHSATPHFKAFMDKASEFAADAPEIRVLTELESI
ncbi:MAG TPA: putative quinol monooxygenase [Desulfosalsimonadaceae bacterium]|nr:putative quinol monooxygenase [Desulfosalsimonadaceae bacterium]